MWVYEKKSLYLDVTWERVWTELLLGFATAKKKIVKRKENAKLLKNNKKNRYTYIQNYSLDSWRNLTFMWFEFLL